MIQNLFANMSAVLAHAGHGHTDAGSLLHALVEPEHAALLVAPLALGGLVLWSRRGRRARDMKDARRS